MGRKLTTLRERSVRIREVDGSIPFRSTKKERHDLRRVFLFGNCKVFHCSVEVNSACAKVFSRSENACTAHQRHPDLRGPILCWHPCCLDATKIDKLRQRFADLFCPLFLLHATQWARLQFLVWRSDAILRVISTGMYGILEWMRGSSQSNHIILRRNGSTCVQNDARYFSLGITVQMYNNKKLLDSFLGFLCLGCNLIPAFWASPDTFHDALFHFRSTIQTRPVSFPRFVSQFSRLCLAVYSDDKLRNRKKNSPKSTPYKRNLVPGWRS